MSRAVWWISLILVVTVASVLLPAMCAALDSAVPALMVTP